MDDEDKVSPETQEEINDALRGASQDSASDRTVNMAKFLRKQYRIFRVYGFSRSQAFTLTCLVAQRVM